MLYTVPTKKGGDGRMNYFAAGKMGEGRIAQAADNLNKRLNLSCNNNTNSTALRNENRTTFSS